MVSIIISSYQPIYFEVLENNISETIGCEYEIIKIDNPNRMGISEAYNLGGNKAQYPYLVFVHEDVLFHTQNWGTIAMSILKNAETGLLGVAGSRYVPYVPSGWWVNGYKFLHFIQNDGESRVNNLRVNFDRDNTKESVFGLDGVFLACRKSVFKEFRFNESLKGFHGYDVDFSNRVSSQYTNWVTGDILIEHFSKGNTDKRWFDALVQARKNYRIPRHQKNDAQAEWFKYKEFIWSMNHFGYSTKDFVFLGMRYLNPKKLGIKNTYYALRRLLSQSIK